MNTSIARSKTKVPPWIIDGLILLIIFGIALALRIIPLQQAVFGLGWVNFQGPDAWYHFRLIENLLQHFPFRISFDPYSFYPVGQEVWFAPLFDELVAAGAWIIGAGTPSPQTIQMVAAYFPPVLGALVTVPVYFIGKALFDRKVGLLAALVLVILPGQFLLISRVGDLDHHVAEVLFSTTSMLFLILALKRIKERPLHFGDIARGDWSVLYKPLILSVLSGFALGLYLLTWVGGLLFAFLFFCWAVLMYVISQLRDENKDYVCIICVPIFLVALLMIIPFLDQLAFSQLDIIALAAGIAAFPVLAVISRLMKRLNIKAAYYPLVLVGAGSLCLLVLYLVSPATIGSIEYGFSQFAPGTGLLTIAEARPMLLVNGPFSLAPLWNAFTTASILAPAAFVLLLAAAFKNIDDAKVLFLAWAILITVGTLAQIRFAEYLTVVFALLSAYLLWRIVTWIPIAFNYFGLKEERVSKREKARKTKEQSKLARGSSAVSNTEKGSWQRQGMTPFKYLWAVSAVIVVSLLGIYPNLPQALLAAGTNSGINKNWHDALVWMKGNTPEPFNNPNAFNELYRKPAAGQNYPYPGSAYGVMTWWDIGHYVTEIAHRIPNSNPNQSGAISAAQYFTATNEAEADQILDRLGSRYVIVDLDMATPFENDWTRKFPAIVSWAGKDLAQYCEIYLQPTQTGKQLTPIVLYYPDYYQCMSTRLYNFHGEQVVPAATTWVISYAMNSGMKVLQNERSFPTYEDAKKFLDNQSSPNFRIVGTSPFVSPVPLAKLARYQQVYQSESVPVQDNQKTDFPFVEIFRYTP
jgi:dolichyl-phosphooligosaccharide-protein glycotransferase